MPNKVKNTSASNIRLLIASYNSGMPALEAGALIGISEPTAIRWLRDRGVAVRGYGPIKMDVMVRFWSKVIKTGRKKSSCWLWTGAPDRDGYGEIQVDGKSQQVHRFAYTNLVGPIQDGFTIDHLCRTRHCVRPSHLEAVTNAENVMRGDGVMAMNARKTHCIRGHKLSSNPADLDRRGGRDCRICRNDRQRSRRRRPRTEYQRKQSLASAMVSTAMKKGLLSRPEVCPKCKKNPGLNRIGRSLIQFHHTHGYERRFWYVGEWLCLDCHTAKGGVHHPHPPETP